MDDEEVNVVVVASMSVSGDPYDGIEPGSVKEIIVSHNF